MVVVLNERDLTVFGFSLKWGCCNAVPDSFRWLFFGGCNQTFTLYTAKLKICTVLEVCKSILLALHQLLYWFLLCRSYMLLHHFTLLKNCTILQCCRPFFCSTVVFALLRAVPKC
ncbi:hypothetical protein AXF42_Ash017580 [Apostasia shenzhenica]|uniref:Uncharacterized protein n=1 Tax=Apostasia shenzhenica TaxID=1088818 RepID=A0A2I0A3B4_9ASPA|nr:hypothetical protein AXF42_Ash017580 [Apostasia shenzhenica]